MAELKSRRAELQRVVRFGAVGLINTVLDFGIFNVGTKFLGLGVIPANTISTTIAMIFSFIANRKVVFVGHRGSPVKQAVAFLIVTAIGLYVIQNGIIHLLVKDYPGPLHAVVADLRSAGDKHFSDGFYINNGAKLVGTVGSLIWNYFLYKRLVFKS
jgi:putative flippase GtrA